MGRGRGAQKGKGKIFLTELSQGRSDVTPGSTVGDKNVNYVLLSLLRLLTAAMKQTVPPG